VKFLQKSKRQAFLLTLPFFKDWSYIHLIELNQKFSEVRYHANDIIYNIGQESDVFYILKTGRIIIETIIEIEEYHKYPVVSSFPSQVW
jgi:hypothetical protein